MDVERVGYVVGARILLSLILTAASVGITIAAFWVLDQIRFFTVDVQLFLDQFAVPYFIALFLLLQLNRGLAFLERQARG